MIPPATAARFMVRIADQFEEDPMISWIESGHRLADGKEAGTATPATARDVDEWRCAARHLAVAASELARDPDLPRDVAARHASAEAMFRAQAEGMDGVGLRPAPDGPAVRLTDREPIGMVALLWHAIRRDGQDFPLRSIDREVVHGAKELLLAIRWALPGEGAELGR